MSLLDNILEMQSQGLSDEEIQENLRQQGFTPKDIHEAFSQLKVREAVSQEYEEVPQPGEAPAYSYQDYGGGSQYTPPSSEMVGEIVEQVVAEKMSSLNKSISSLANLKESFEERLKDMENRIRKVEEGMEALQRAIIGRIGDYGKDIKKIHDEMGMMQESFSKVLNPLVDRARKKEEGEKNVESEEKTEKEGEEAGREKSEEDRASEPEEESGLEREHFNFDALRKIGRGKG